MRLSELILLTGLILIYSCTFSGIKSNLKKEIEDIIVINQCDGVYEYSGKELLKKLKFKIDSNDVYIENPIEYDSEEIIIGFRYKQEEIDSISYYSKYYTLAKEAVKIVKYIEVEKYKVVVIERENLRSKKIEVDTFNHCGGVMSSTRYLRYNCINKKEEFERFYCEDISENGNKVYSRKGNIFHKTSEGVIQITNFKGKFNSKFGNGFFDPKFIKGDKSILFGKLTGFLSKKIPSIYEYDIEKRETIKFIEGEFFNRKVSKNGEFMLFSRADIDDYKTDLNCRNYTVYLMNLSTKDIVKLGRGSFYEWKNNTAHHR